MNHIDDLWEYYDQRKKEGADKEELQTIRFCIGWLIAEKK